MCAKKRFALKTSFGTNKWAKIATNIMKYVRWIILSLLGASALGVVTTIGVVIHFSRNLPSLDAIKNYTPLLVTTVYSGDDKVVAEYSTERRIPLSPDEMPVQVTNAFIAAEDDEFFSHRGINPVTILRAAIKNFQAGHTVQGGSTITQQVAKSILLSPEKSYTRKIREVLLAFRIERELTKQEILTLYLNHIFLGQGSYGVEAASQTYFNKKAAELTIPEAAILAGLPRAPSRDNPIANPKAAKQRQLYVLGRLLATQKISKAEYDRFVEEPVAIRNKQEFTSKSPAPYFTEHVRRYLVEKYGSEAVYEQGLKVYTTLNLTDQIAAQDSLKTGLLALDKRMGLRAPSKHLKNAGEISTFTQARHKEITEKFYDFKNLTQNGELEYQVDLNKPTPLVVGKNYPGVVVEKDAKKTKYIVVQVGNRRGFIKPEDYKWVTEANPEDVYKEKAIRNPIAELKIGDVITIQPKILNETGLDEYFLEQEPLAQGALLSYRIPDGAITTLVGGYDFYVTKSEFNRATQAVRQPGSTFKPILFSAALDAGLTPSTIVVDSPLVYRSDDEQSELEKVWRPDNYDKKFYGDMTLRQALNLSRNIPAIKLLQYLKIPAVIEYSQKLGIKSPMPSDLSIALGSSGMTLQELISAWGIFANKGNRLKPYFIKKIVDRNGETLEEYVAPAEERVLPESTAFLMTSLLKSVVEVGTGTPVKPLGRPVAGKTGTTSDYKDALFVGYIPELITGVWVGFDEDRPLGRNELGGRAAAPIWLQYMQVAASHYNQMDWDPPSSVEQVLIDAETGDVPGPQTKKRYSEYFAKGTAPGTLKGSFNESGEFVPDPSGAVNRVEVVTGYSNVVPQEGSKDLVPQSDVPSDELMREDF